MVDCDFIFYCMKGLKIPYNFNLKKKKLRRAWTPGRFSEVATALRLLPLKALAQNVQD